MKKFADENFKFDKNGRKLSKQVENTVREGEIAHYEQFLLLPPCFQKACFPEASLCGNGLRIGQVQLYAYHYFTLKAYQYIKYLD